MDSHNSIEIRNLHKEYRIISQDRKIPYRIPILPKKRTNVVFDNLNLSVKKGEVLGVIGRNGSGKTTLLKLITKIVQPDSGTVETDGHVVSILELNLGFDPELSGYDNIFLICELHGMKKERVQGICDSIVRYSKLGDYIYNPVKTYSSGMRTRLSYAILTNINADIYLFDVGVGGGDVVFSNKIYGFIKRLTKSNKTVIICTHSLRSIENFCDRVVWIDNSKISMEGKPWEVCPIYKYQSIYSSDSVEAMGDADYPHALYNLALTDRDEGRMDNYKEKIRRASIFDNPEALIKKADYIYAKGDVSEAEHFYRMASNHRNQEAYRKYGMIRGNINKEIESLISFYEKAAESGDPEIIFNYASLLDKIGIGDSDAEKAFSLYMIAYENGNTDACYNIAEMYMSGKGTFKSASESIKMYTIAATAGHMKSQIKLGKIYGKGLIVKRDLQQSLKWYLMSAEQGDAESQHIVARMYHDGLGTDINPEESKKWYARYVRNSLSDEYLIAVNKSELSKTDHGFDFESATKHIEDTRNSKVIRNINKAAKSHKTELRKLADNYFYGNGVEIDYSKAFELYQQAASEGSADAMYSLAMMYKNNIFVQYDEVQYKQLIKDAASKGHKKSKETVDRWERRNEKRRMKRK
ncbi:MAG: ATP-binding cassette domain-containing protein [Thermoplasmata archaeon]|nr:ATP-binding cassette domain-containing protein [Thermoplasmata archaeon]